MTFATLLSLSFLAALASASPMHTNPDPFRPNYQTRIAPLNTPPNARVINSSYIVVLSNHLSPLQFATHIESVQRHAARDSLFMSDDGGLSHVYDMAGLKGYAGMFEESTIDMLRAQEGVEYVERDTEMHALDYETQVGAPWGLARISHRNQLGLSSFNKYLFDDDGGEGVDAYVIDTGIFVGHSQFEGRARWGKTMPKNDVDEDGNGHGTHCAGTIASKKYGVAKKAHLVAVKVLGSNGSGSTADVIGGVQWALNDATATREAARAEELVTGKRKYKGAVANMSLGGGKSPSLDRAVNAAVEGGLHFSVAAGNDNSDACNSSPASAELAVTVGASTLNDERAYFSNHGSCVDIFAPGLNILSTWNAPGATNVISGTSMAAPHTAGLMAYLLSLYPSPSFNPPVKKYQTIDSTYRSLCSVARSTFPSWMTIFLPVETLAVAPVPPVEITTKAMKAAVLKLGTSDVLSSLPAKTINLLIYNNATGIDGYDRSFWESLL